MTSGATTIEEYLGELEPKRQEALARILSTIRDNLPDGFQEGMHYGMVGFVVPLSTYPRGYHAKKNEPLPFISVAAQKQSINLYHAGIYALPTLEAWFRTEWPKYMKTKLDMGKSCIRLKNMNTIPFALIAKLASRMSPLDVIALYETHRGSDTDES